MRNFDTTTNVTLKIVKKNEDMYCSTCLKLIGPKKKRNPDFGYTIRNPSLVYSIVTWRQ